MFLLKLNFWCGYNFSKFYLLRYLTGSVNLINKKISTSPRSTLWNEISRNSSIACFHRKLLPLVKLNMRNVSSARWILKLSICVRAKSKFTPVLFGIQSFLHRALDSLCHKIIIPLYHRNSFPRFCYTDS